MRFVVIVSRHMSRQIDSASPGSFNTVEFGFRNRFRIRLSRWVLAEGPFQPLVLLLDFDFMSAYHRRVSAYA